MIIPTLAGFVAGEKVTGAKLTLHTKTAFDFMASKPFCKIAQTGSQSIPTTPTKVLLPTIVEDTDGMADVANNQIVFKTAGVYAITGHLNWGGNATGYRQVELFVGPAGSPALVLTTQPSNNAGNSGSSADFTHYMRCSVNDVAWFQSNNSGVTLAGTGGALTAEWVTR